MSNLLGELFSSRVRAAVLSYLLARPHREFGLSELSRVLGLPVSSLQHECYKLVRIGVLADRREGAGRHYRPNGRSPLLTPLTALVLRVLGPEALAAAAEGIAEIDLAFLTGDLDGAIPATLVVVGGLDVEALDGLLSRVSAVLAALERPPPELAFFPPAEWRRRLDRDDPLVRGLLAAPSRALVGAPPVSGEIPLSPR